MTAPAQVRPAAAPVSLSRALLIAGTVLFVLAAFAAGGGALGHVAAWSFGFGGFAAWVLPGAVT